MLIFCPSVVSVILCPPQGRAPVRGRSVRERASWRKTPSTNAQALPERRTSSAACPRRRATRSVSRWRSKPTTQPKAHRRLSRQSQRKGQGGRVRRPVPFRSEQPIRCGGRGLPLSLRRLSAGVRRQVGATERLHFETVCRHVIMHTVVGRCERQMAMISRSSASRPVQRQPVTILIPSGRAHMSGNDFQVRQMFRFAFVSRLSRSCGRQSPFAAIVILASERHV
jgi:hypothetical protein